MQIEDPALIDSRYAHIYLSPHLDDAALSCGGSIAALTARGAKVLVVTICTAAPFADAPGAAAQALHAHTPGSPEETVAARLREDRLAMQRLGADFHWANELDAIYRGALYASAAALFAAPAAGDPLRTALGAFVERVQRQAPAAAVYAPLGVGGHVDHVIAHDCVRDAYGARALFYEDLPYAIAPRLLSGRLEQVAAASSVTLPIDGTLERKLHGVAAYTSQLAPLFGGAAQMRRHIASYARGLQCEGARHGERLWRLRPLQEGPG